MSDADESASPFPDDFRAAVAARLVAVGYALVGWHPYGVDVRPPCGDAQSIGLVNLHRRVRTADTADWADMIREFLDHRAEALHALAIPDDLTSIVSQLRPRLGRPCDRSGKTPPWGIPLPGTGLEINLVVDFPHTMAYVTEPMLARGRRKGEDLLDVALENLRAATPGDFLERATPDLDLFLGHTGDGYDSARALLVEELMPDSPAGFWVAVPSREELAVWPVSFPALERIPALKRFAEDNFRQHPYPVTDEVFWVWQGMWHRFGIIEQEDEILLDPPDPFEDALRELDAPG